MRTSTVVPLVSALVLSGALGCDKIEKIRPRPEAMDVKQSEAQAAAERATSEAAQTAKLARQVDPVAHALAGYEAYSKGDLDRASKGFAQDVTFTLVGAGAPLMGREAVRARWETVRAGISDHSVRPTRVFDLQNGTVVLEGVERGTHTGPFMGQAATQRPVGWKFLHVFAIKDGKVATAKLYRNHAALLAQTGVLKGMPAPAVPAAPTSDAPTVISGKGDEANVKAVKAFYQKVFSAEDPTAVLKEACGDTCTREDGDSGRVSDLAAQAAWVSDFKKAMSDIKVQVSSATAVGDYVLSQITLKAKHTGPYLGAKPSDKDVSIDMYEVTQFKDGKMLHTVGYANPMQLMVQLGLAPAPADPTKPAEPVVAAAPGAPAAADKPADAAPAKPGTP